MPTNLGIATFLLVFTSASFAAEAAIYGLPLLSGVCLVLSGIVYAQELRK